MIQVRLEPGDVGDQLGDVKRRIPSEMRELVSTIVIAAQGDIQDETPTGAFGILKGSYSTEVRQRGNRTRGAVINPQLYHDPADRGRRPGAPPPTSALVPWVAVKLGVPIDQRQQVAFLVARAIGRRGTEGANMVATGWEQTRRRVKPLLRKHGLRMTEPLR